MAQDAGCCSPDGRDATSVPPTSSAAKRLIVPESPALGGGAAGSKLSLVDNLGMVAAALRDTPSRAKLSVSDAVGSQRAWLERASRDAEDGAEAPPSASARGLAMRAKLKAAIRVTMVSNRGKRFFANGKERNSVVVGAKEEAKAHHPSGWASFLSSHTQEALESTYTSLGKWIERNHKVSLVIGFLILISGLPGTFFLTGSANFLWLKVDVELKSMALSTTVAYKDYDRAVHAHHGFFHPPRTGAILFSPTTTGPAVLSTPFMLQSLEILNHVYHNITATGHDGTVYRYPQLCARNGRRPPPADAAAAAANTELSACSALATDVFGAVNHDPAELTAFDSPTYHGALEARAKRLNTMLSLAVGEDTMSAFIHAHQGDPFNITNQFHQALRYVDASEPYTVWRPSTLQVRLALEYPHDEEFEELIVAWETAAATYLTGNDRPYRDTLRVSTIVESTFASGMQDGLYSIVPWLFVVVGCMTAYAGLFLTTQTRVGSGETTQFSLITQGSAVSGLAGFSSFGWIYYLGGESINILCIVAIFLVSAVGVDCTFIFVSAMKATGPKTPLVEAVPLALAEGASAITLTSLTSICAFVVAALTSSAQPAFAKFNWCMAIALLLNFLGFVFFFSAFQVHNEHRILEDKADLAPWRKRKPGKVPSWADVGGKLRNALNSAYAPLMEDYMKPANNICKLVGAAVIVATFGVSLGFVGSIGVGMPDQYYVLDTNYLYDLVGDYNSLTNGTRVASIDLMVEHLDLGDNGPGGRLGTFATEVLAPIGLRDDVLTISCLPALYYRYTATTLARQAAAVQLPNGTSFPPPLLEWRPWLEGEHLAHLADHKQALLDLYGRAHYGTETGQFSGKPVPRTINCALAVLTSSGADSQPRIDVMNWYHDHAARVNAKYADTCFPCDATRVTFSAHDWALKTSLDEELPALCWTTIGYSLLTVGLVLMFALPIHRALISVLNIFLVVFAIIGFMGYAQISYNLISYCTLTMAIGFCVDYTVELMHFSVIGAPADSMGLKFANALRACGYDVLHGCATAVIGVFILGLTGAEYARLFSYMCMVMCFYGGAYALWCLPSSMTLVAMASGQRDGLANPSKARTANASSNKQGGGGHAQPASSPNAAAAQCAAANLAADAPARPSAWDRIGAASAVSH